MVVKNYLGLALIAGMWMSGAANAQSLTPVPISSKSFSVPIPASRFRQQASTPAVMEPAARAWPTAEAQSARLSQGVLNRAFDPAHPSESLDTTRHFGLAALRLKLDLFAHMDNQGLIDASYLQALETVIDQAVANDVPVILTEDNSAPCSILPDSCAPLMQAVWSQLSTRFKAKGPQLMFELLSNPEGRLTADTWNALQARLITTIRTDNPTRTLIVTPSSGVDLKALEGLKLPADDRNLIVALRFNDPAASEAEPTPAMLNIKALRDAEDARDRALDATLSALGHWARVNDRPVFLKEVGSQNPEAVKYRKRWMATLISLAAQKGLGWGLGDAASVLKPETIKEARAQGNNAQMDAALPRDLSAN